jgi:tetratricopeptide (TPR) repeat protein
MLHRVEARSSTRIQLLVTATLLVAAVFALFADTTSGPFVWDDAYQIADNQAVTSGVPLSAYFLDRSTTTTRADYNTRVYRPLRNVAFRAIAVTLGVSGPIYRFCNLVLFAVSVVLVMLVGVRLWGSPLIAGLAALVWAVLPVHVEPVCYPSALGDLLSLALMLGAFLACLAVIQGTAHPRAFTGAAVLLALLAMLAKEMAVTTALVVGAFVLLSGRRSAAVDRLLLALAGVTVAYLALRTSVVGTVGQEAVTPAAVARGLREAPVLLLAYGKIIVAPLGHRTAYLVAFPGAAGLLLVLLAIAALAVGAWLLDRRQRSGAGFRMALGWFAIVLIPVLHLVPLWADLADRFALVPSVAVALLVGQALSWTASAPRRAFIWALSVAPLVMMYSAGTRIEQRYWSSDRALWLHSLAEQPDSGMAWSNLAGAYLNTGEFELAVKAYDRANELHYADARSFVCKAMALEGSGRAGEALAVLDAALRADPADAEGQALRGDLLRRKGDLTGARAALERARSLSPRHPSVALLEAALARSEGRPAEAAALYLRLVERVPRIARFRYLAAQAALDAGDSAAASRQASECLRLQPGQPQCMAVLEIVTPARTR